MYKTEGQNLYLCPRPRRIGAHSPCSSVFIGVGSQGWHRGVQKHLPKYQIRWRESNFPVTVLIYCVLVGFFKIFYCPLLKRKLRRPNKARPLCPLEWDLWGFCELLNPNRHILSTTSAKEDEGVPSEVSVCCCARRDTASSKSAPSKECWRLTWTEMSPSSPDALIKTASLTLIFP